MKIPETILSIMILSIVLTSIFLSLIDQEKTIKKAKENNYQPKIQDMTCDNKTLFGYKKNDTAINYTFKYCPGGTK
jgi:hypothetical protein